MSTEWNAEGTRWPGASWWRVDLHAHSPASYDFKDTADWKGWLEAARDAGIDAVAVTDHNTAVGITHLKEAIAQVDNPPVLFPGMELTANDGTHLLLILSSECTQQHVEDLLTAARVPIDQRNGLDDVARSPLSVEQLFEELFCDRGLIIVGAHVNAEKGLLKHVGQQRIQELRHLNLIAVEVKPPILSDDAAWLNGKPEVGRVIPQIYCSDSHALNEAGRRFTWVKMTRPDIEGLRLALLDGADSLKPTSIDAPGDPNSHAHCLIESMTVHDARYIGPSQPFTISFNPWFSAIIGGRGTGKSTLLDLLRKVFRREAGLSGDLAVEFERRMRIPEKRDELGLLREHTRVEVTYRKDGERFVLAWDQQGVTIVRLNGENREAEAGDIRERFPVRIYSQKQLFEHARNPNSLLKLIDEVESVGGAALGREHLEAETQYLSLCAEVRSLRARAADLPMRKASLEDVRRKLSIVEKEGNAEVRREFALRRRQNAAWTSIRSSVQESVLALERAADGLVVADLDVAGGDADEPQFAALRRMHGRVKAVVGTLRTAVGDAVAQAGASLAAIDAGDEALCWSKLMAECELRYEEFRKQLEESGIANPNEHDVLLQRAVTLEEEIRTLEQRQIEAEDREQEALRALERYREIRSKLTTKRSAFVNDVSNDLIRVKVHAYADADDMVCEAFLRGTLGVSRFDGEHKVLCEKILPVLGSQWSYEALDSVVKELRDLFVDPQKQLSFLDNRRFESALRRIVPEKLDRLALYAPSDHVEVSFQDTRDGSWRRLEQGSPGQQTAALLAFVLSYGHEPIFLDQPEDDLDSTIIYELLVQRLRTVKQTRQVIVVTHNPNIVVHGDAEYVVSLKAEGRTTISVEGGLQERKTREEICSVMEGGRTAFEERYRRIAPFGTEV